MGKAHTSTDLNFDPRPSTSKLSDLGQRLNKLCNLSSFQFPFWTKKVLTGISMLQLMWEAVDLPPWDSVLWTSAPQWSMSFNLSFAFNLAFFPPCLVSYSSNNRNINWRIFKNTGVYQISLYLFLLIFKIIFNIFFWKCSLSKRKSQWLLKTVTMFEAGGGVGFNLL